MTALLAITLLSLLGIVLALLDNRRLRAETARRVRDADERADAEMDAAKVAELRTQSAERIAALLKEQLAAAERRARSRESKYSRRQPETPAPLPENAP